MTLLDHDSSILVIFCRRPALGVGKQRIAASLGKHAALQAAEHLLDCAIEDGTAWDGPVVIAPAEPQDALWAANRMPEAAIMPQTAGNLGQRIQNVYSEIAGAGGRKALFIGSDAPDLTAAELREAAESLHDHDVVLIPAYDGGVTLLGSRIAWPELRNLGWETDQLCTDLLAACNTAGLTVKVMATGHDTDTYEDLLAAGQRLTNDRRVSRHRLVDWIDTLADHSLSISIIIPLLNDQLALQTQLQRLELLEPPANEIIVVDGGNNEESRSICQQHKVQYLISEPNRGKQLLAGSQNTAGDILWFLHVDCIAPDCAVASIRTHLQAGMDSGYFRFRFAGKPTWYKQLLQFSINLRARYGTPYGDQGLFVRRTSYEKANGHAPTPLFEEVPLVKQLRQGGKFRPVADCLQISPRRWERDGWLYRSLHNRYLAIAYMCGIAPERLARQYEAPDSGNQLPRR
jgi:rSAM/selenodomain-associated transferase 2/rSAM/selenodomain-associated transferase 1